MQGALNFALSLATIKNEIGNGNDNQVYPEKLVWNELIERQSDRKWIYRDETESSCVRPLEKMNSIHPAR